MPPFLPSAMPSEPYKWVTTWSKSQNSSVQSGLPSTTMCTEPGVCERVPNMYVPAGNRTDVGPIAPSTTTGGSVFPKSKSVRLSAARCAGRRGSG